MATIALLRNPLAPHTREIAEVADGREVIDWLQENYPNGFGMPCRYFLNGKEQSLDDLDHRLEPDDVAIIAVMPGAAGGFLASMAVSLVISLVLSGVSYLLGQLFQPKQRSGAKGDTTTIYDVSSDQNAARIGEPIPVVYGTVITTPDYVAQPYNFFAWAQSRYDQWYSGVQYLNLLLCVGQGNIDVDAVYLGDTGANVPPADVVYWKAFKPAEHRQTLGVISSAMGGGFHENIITSPEVSNQEFAETNDAAGFFATCKPGQKGTVFSIDIVFPGGLTNPNSSGDVQGRFCEWTVYWQELNDADALVGPVYSRNLFARTDAKSGTYLPDAWGTSVPNMSQSEKNRSIISSPIRRTYYFATAKSARWAVKLVRVTAAPNAKNGTSRFIWTGLRLFADYPPGPAYGNVTLLALRIKASQGMGENAAARIRVKCTRQLQPPGGGAEARSNSAIDAFADVYTNSVYGAKRPRSELDLTTFSLLHTKWAAYQFNNVFRDRITVWDALRTITTPSAAEPYPVGATMSIAQDGVKPVRAMLFTDANIVEGSMTVGYSFDEEGSSDGVEIEYIDPIDFKQVYTRWPLTSTQPDQFSLPGVTNATHASQYARLTWQRRLGQRKRVKFDTELEGLLAQIGDRIGIAHNVPKWGDSGLVVAVSGLNVIVDHDLDWSGGAKQIMFRKPDGGVTDPVTVTRGTADNIVVLPTSSSTTLNWDNDNEYTSFAFGSATTLVRDFIVTATTPASDNTVTIEGMNYNTAIFAGGMSFL